MSEIKIETASAGGGGGGSGTVTSVALNLGTSGTDVNRTGSPITTAGTFVLNIPVASAANTGKLSNTDWSTFNGKQAALVSGTNIKTVNSTTLLGSGDLAVQAVLVSGTNIKTINSNSLLGAGNLDVQELLVSGGNINTINGVTILGPGNTQLQVPLVSGTNIKTINGTTLLGSGDISVSAAPAGSTGQVQFNNAGSLGADATLFWDNTNKRLGVGTNAPSEMFSVQKETAGFANSMFVGHKGATNYNGLRIGTLASGVGYIQSISGSSMTAYYDMYLNPNGAAGVYIGSATGSPGARLDVKSLGTTSGSSILKLQNSAGSTAMEVRSDRVIILTGTPTSAAGLPTGSIYSNAGVLTLVP